MNGTMPSFRKVKATLPDTRPAYLTERHWQILQERQAGRTLEAIAADLHVSRERVRQLEARASQRLVAVSQGKTVRQWHDGTRGRSHEVKP